MQPKVAASFPFISKQNQGFSRQTARPLLILCTGVPSKFINMPTFFYVIAANPIAPSSSTVGPEIGAEVRLRAKGCIGVIFVNK